MKKILLTLMLVFALCTPVCAFNNEPICDNAALLSEEGAAELSAYISELRDAYSMDIAVYTEQQMSGSGAEQTADNIFDSLGYGFGENADGILLYISAEPRNYHFTTHGAAIDIFNDANLEYIEQNVLAYLKEDDYDSAVSVYADCAAEVLEDPSGESTAADGAPQPEDTTAHNMIVILCGLLLPLIIAFVATRIRLAKMHTAVKDDYAASYVKKGSMNITRSRDIFLYSTITKTEKPKPQESDTHTSSSGETHGGRGGSY